MLSNKEIEEKAIEFIKSKYRNVKDAPPGSGYDLRIGNKIVEVKGTASSKARQNIYLSREPEYRASQIYKKRYWIYRVINVGKQNIKVISIPAKFMEMKKDPRWRVKIKKGFLIKAQP